MEVDMKERGWKRLRYWTEEHCREMGSHFYLQSMQHKASEETTHNETKLLDQESKRSRAHIPFVSPSAALLRSLLLHSQHPVSQATFSREVSLRICSVSSIPRTLSVLGSLGTAEMQLRKIARRKDAPRTRPHHGQKKSWPPLPLQIQLLPR